MTEHATHHLQQNSEEPPIQRPAEQPTGFTVRIPKPNWQVTVLLLIALVAAFQTFQLTRLKGSVSAKTVTSTTAPPASTAASSATSSGDLQSQVGGC